MPQPPSDSQPTSHAVELGGAALAAGAVIAGLAFRGKSSLPIAAGLAAAAASVRLFSKSRTSTAPGKAVPPSKEVPAPEGAPEPDPVPPDWVDSAAVLPSDGEPAVVSPPEPAPLAEIPGQPAFPLLDDDGVPVEHSKTPVPVSELTGALPLGGATPEFEFPLGPLIWEPGQDVVSCSEDNGETVWFGLNDLPVEEPSVPREPAAPPPGAISSPFAAYLDLEADAAPDPAPEPAAGSAVEAQGSTAGPMESVSSIVESLRTGTAPLMTSLPDPMAVIQEPGPAVHEAPAPAALPVPTGSPQAEVTLPTPPPTGATGAAGEPLSFADWMLGTQAQDGAAPEPATPAHTPTALPQPRRAGEAPRVASQPAQAGPVRMPSESGGGRRSLPESRRTPGEAERGITHRSVEPLAPSQPARGATYRPIAFVIVTVILAGVLLVAALWRNRGFEDAPSDAPWKPEPAPDGQVITTPPKGSAPEVVRPAL